MKLEFAIKYLLVLFLVLPKISFCRDNDPFLFEIWGIARKDGVLLKNKTLLLDLNLISTDLEDLGMSVLTKAKVKTDGLGQFRIHSKRYLNLSRKFYIIKSDLDDFNQSVRSIGVASLYNNKEKIKSLKEKLEVLINQRKELAGSSLKNCIEYVEHGHNLDIVKVNFKNAQEFNLDRCYDKCNHAFDTLCHQNCEALESEVEKNLSFYKKQLEDSLNRKSYLLSQIDKKCQDNEKEIIRLNKNIKVKKDDIQNYQDSSKINTISTIRVDSLDKSIDMFPASKMGNSYGMGLNIFLNF